MGSQANADGAGIGVAKRRRFVASAAGRVAVLIGIGVVAWAVLWNSGIARVRYDLAQPVRTEVERTLAPGWLSVELGLGILASVAVTRVLSGRRGTALERELEVSGVALAPGDVALSAAAPPAAGPAGG